MSPGQIPVTNLSYGVVQTTALNGQIDNRKFHLQYGLTHSMLHATITNTIGYLNQLKLSTPRLIDRGSATIHYSNKP